MTADRLPRFGTATATGAPGRSRLLVRTLARPSLPAWAGLLLALLLFSWWSPGLFTPTGVTGVLDIAAPLGIGAVAVGLLLVAGQFDFSVGIVAVGSALVTALLVGYAGWSAWPALLVSLLCALAVGLVNGVLVVNTGLPSFLVTLATLLVLQGVTLVGTEEVTGSGRVGGLADAPGWSSAAAVFSSTVPLGGVDLRVSLLWWLAVTVLATWVLWRTRFGNAVLAIGGARRAARELGVAVRRTTVASFCLTATAGWLIGTLGLMRLGGVAAVPGLASGVDYLVVAVIGGCLLTGGRGSAVGAAVSALLYAVALQGVVLAGWDPRWFQAVLGGLLIVALLLNGAVRRRLKAVPRS